MRRLALAALLVLAACGDDDDDVGTTADPTTTTTGATTTTTSTTVASTSDPVRLTVAADGVLGWWDGTSWVRSDSGAALPVQGGETYQVVRLDEPITTATGSGPVDGCELGDPRRQSIEVDLGSPSGLNDGKPVAITGVPDPRPRPVVILGADAHRAAADEVLAVLGLDPTGSEVIQVVGGDLLGDGTDETVVVVERAPDLLAEPGDYSVAFLRIVVDGEVRTEVLSESVNTSTPEEPSPYILQSRVGAFADLNGDGRMEVVLSQHYYEGSGTIAYEVADDGAAPEVLGVGCGA